MLLTKIKYIVLAGRPNQWVKNLVIFTAIMFAGKLFDPELMGRSLYAFVVFCLLSSTSYILNDVIDYPYDRKHPLKKFRPVASGKLSIPDATFVVFGLSLFTLLLALQFSVGFFILSLVFLSLHFFYSMYFKKHAVLDIFTISFSFILRAFAGQIATGYHIQVWLFLTIFFISLFIATVKRQAELIRHGSETRQSLNYYKEHLIQFLSTTFATSTIIAYSLYTFLEKPPLIETKMSAALYNLLPGFETRKWFVVTIPLVVYGIARYAQLLYEKEQGETPEKIITKDIPLIATILSWGVIVISLIYVF
ncbi:MAG TPA: UbiA prenyltransferase family protein [Candidatus Nitrosocosmicus sp.]|nr:UbiA prenyltransferase family protein [Candidatus Nitrosocosmicus sp.]